MYVFFDTETTGLPRNYNAPASELSNWPRMVQLAYLVYDAQGTLLATTNDIVRPDGFAIPADAASIHGITTARAEREGRPLAAVLGAFDAAVREAEFLVAHNMRFDEKIVGAEFLRVGQKNPIADKKRICTMERSTDFCRIPGRYGPKWPKLGELYAKIFDEPLLEAHNAAVDIQATAKCFWELRRRKIV